MKRIEQLRAMGCPDTHPIVAWRLQRLAALQEQVGRPSAGRVQPSLEDAG